MLQEVSGAFPEITGVFQEVSLGFKGYQTVSGVFQVDLGYTRGSGAFKGFSAGQRCFRSFSGDLRYSPRAS